MITNLWISIDTMRENFRNVWIGVAQCDKERKEKWEAHRVGSAAMIDDHPSIIAQLKFKLMDVSTIKSYESR